MTFHRHAKLAAVFAAIQLVMVSAEGDKGGQGRQADKCPAEVIQQAIQDCEADKANQMSQLEAAAHQLKGDAEGQIEALNNLVAQKDQELAQKDAQKGDELSSLQSSLASAQQASASRQASLENAQSQLEKLAKELESAQNAAEKAQKEKEQAEKASKSGADASGAEAKEAKKAAEAAQKKVKEAGEKLKKAEKKASDAEKKLAKVEKSAVEEKKKSEKLQQEVEAAQAASDKAQAQVKIMKKLEKLEKEGKEDLEKELSRLNQEKSDVTSQMFQIQSESGKVERELKKRVKEMEKELAEMQGFSLSLPTVDLTHVWSLFATLYRNLLAENYDTIRTFVVDNGSIAVTTIKDTSAVATEKGRVLWTQVNEQGEIIYKTHVSPALTTGTEQAKTLYSEHLQPHLKPLEQPLNEYKSLAQAQYDTHVHPLYVQHVEPVYEGSIKPAAVQGWEVTKKTVEDLKLKEHAEKFYEVASTQGTGIVTDGYVFVTEKAVPQAQELLNQNLPKFDNLNSTYANAKDGVSEFWDRSVNTIQPVWESARDGSKFAFKPVKIDRTNSGLILKGDQQFTFEGGIFEMSLILILAMVALVPVSYLAYYLVWKLALKTMLWKVAIKGVAIGFVWGFLVKGVMIGLVLGLSLWLLGVAFEILRIACCFGCCGLCCKKRAPTPAPTAKGAAGGNKKGQARGMPSSSSRMQPSTNKPSDKERRKSQEKKIMTTGAHAAPPKVHNMNASASQNSKKKGKR